MARQETFDRIYLTAVWMHLDEAEREIGMATLRHLVAPDGLIIMSLRHGPVPEGRRMFEVSARETEMLAENLGLSVAFRGERGDMLGRPDVSWSILALTPG